ncbi:dipeptidase [Rugosimonospora africana]|uniref:Dipeptidase n=1 Tax=Rugosimonospora africana TaxID=556532 RepID=A0A8J3QXI4_9ACTN|nr:dipeptidase [Rugosimonospora africana]GIH17585.1 dipeptidase [Rugosimonospora africana]
MVTERFRPLLASAPVIDGHNDLPWEMRGRVRYDLDRLDVGVDQSGSGLHTDLVRLRAGGVGAQFWSVYVSVRLPGEEAVAATLEQIDFVHRLAERYSDRMALARTADEIEAVRESGRIAALIGVEGGHCINDSLDNLRMLFDRGAMYLTLTHSLNTAWADSATDAPRVGGLGPFGYEVVRECNRLGMLVDLSHVAVSTMEAVLDTSVAPPFFSHSSARALCDHTRNVPDSVLERVGESAGIVMVAFVPGFLTDDCREWMAEQGAFEATITMPDDSPQWRDELAAWIRAHPRPPCTVADVADHVEHIREVAGVDCVGLGGDFDGIAATPDGLADVSGYPNLLEELSGRGWSDADLAKLTWHNAMRVIRETARYADPLAEPTAA